MILYMFIWKQIVNPQNNIFLCFSQTVSFPVCLFIVSDQNIGIVKIFGKKADCKTDRRKAFI